MTTRWKTALAAAGGAAVAALAVITLSGRASEDAGASVPPDTTPTTSAGATPADGRTITVSGRGSVQVVPDIAELGAGVQSTAATASAALDSVGTGSQALVETLRGLGIADDDIQTSGLSLWPQFDQDGREITGYQASTSVSTTIRDVARVGEVVDALKGLVGDELTLNGVSFSFDDPEAVLAEARAEAVTNARVRAEQYAAAADAEVGQILRIIEGGASDPIELRAAAPEAADSSLAIAPGSQDLTADVTVVFAVE